MHIKSCFAGFTNFKKDNSSKGVNVMLYLNKRLIELKKFPNGEVICDIEDVLNEWYKDRCSFKSDDGKFIYELKLDCYPSDLNNTSTGHDVAASTSVAASLSDMIIQLLLVVNAIKNDSFYKLNKDCCLIYLDIPMLPYARQDRWMGDGTSIANKVFIDLLNNLKLDGILTNDIHSDSSRVLFDDGVLIERTQAECFLDAIRHTYTLSKLFKSNEKIVFISPDSGAYKKVFGVAAIVSKQYNMDIEIVTAQKHRDLKTGKINSTAIDLSHLATSHSNAKENPKFHLFVIDDLCDGGRTFIELSKAIDVSLNSVKGGYTKNLFITHGLFTKGRKVVEQHFDNVYAYNDLFK